MSPDRSERIMVTSLLMDLYISHPWMRHQMMNRVLDMFQFIESAELDHVPARMAVHLLDLLDR
jgi:hypothetical protein